MVDRQLGENRHQERNHGLHYALFQQMGSHHPSIKRGVSLGDLTRSILSLAQMYSVVLDSIHGVFLHRPRLGKERHLVNGEIDNVFLQS